MTASASAAFDKLDKIKAMCGHPSYVTGSGERLAAAIRKVINDEIDTAPILYALSEVDEPIHYELVHDAVYEDEALSD